MGYCLMHFDIKYQKHTECIAYKICTWQSTSYYLIVYFDFFAIMFLQKSYMRENRTATLKERKKKWVTVQSSVVKKSAKSTFAYISAIRVALAEVSPQGVGVLKCRTLRDRRHTLVDLWCLGLRYIRAPLGQKTHNFDLRCLQVRCQRSK